MKKTALLAILALGSVGLGCSNLASDIDTANNGAENLGSVHFALSLAQSGVTISTASYAISGPASYTRSGTLSAVAGTGPLSGLLGGIPAGKGYIITLNGAAADGSATCQGSASFDVTTHATTPVSVPFVCLETLSGGSASITNTTNVCPVVDGVAASPTVAESGGSIALTGVTHDKDNGPAALAPHWTATAGTFDTAAAQNPTFTCPTTVTPVTVTITLTITDGGPGCSDSMSLTVTCG